MAYIICYERDGVSDWWKAIDESEVRAFLIENNLSDKDEVVICGGKHGGFHSPCEFLGKGGTLYSVKVSLEIEIPVYAKDECEACQNAASIRPEVLVHSLHTGDEFRPRNFNVVVQSAEDLYDSYI